MEQIDRIRSATFWGLFVVSAFLSTTLYMGLVGSNFDKAIMFVVSVAIEGLKVLTLTWANSSLWQALQLKTAYPYKSFNRKSFSLYPHLSKDFTFFRKKKSRAFVLFIVYTLTAVLSVTASLGYILQTIDKAFISEVIVSTDSTKEVIQKQISLKERAIEQNNQTIVQYNKRIDLLDIEAWFYTRDFEALNKKISEVMDNNALLLAEINTLTSSIIELRIQDATAQKVSVKSMYQLMSEVLKVSDKNLRFLLLGALALLIEVGIFVCSPQYHKMDPELQVVPEAQKLVPDVVPPVEPPKVKKAIVKPVPAEEPFPETPVELVVPEPVVPKKAGIVKYIEALYDNEGKSYLKDKVLACDDAGISRSDGAQYFNWLTTHKVNGYPMVEFRKEANNWFPNVTSEIAKNHAVGVKEFHRREV